MAATKTDNSKKYTLSQNQARELAGKSWSVEGRDFQFIEIDPAEPGSPPWKSGAEGRAFPLLDTQGRTKAYAKFFNRAKLSRKRIERTKWLVGQNIDSWAVELRGAPRLWIDTTRFHRPEDIDFDFCCSLCDAVPGKTWTEIKFDLARGRHRMSDELRLRCCQNLVRGLTLLEQRGLVHGDLSPNNILIDTTARANTPALHMIDFDAFYSARAGNIAGLSAGEKGTYGTEGYCPPELEERVALDPDKTVPFSDRHARDMLLLEILCFGKGCDPENSIRTWDSKRVRSQLGKNSLIQMLPHLSSHRVFEFKEKERPGASDLAVSLCVNGPTQSPKTARFHMPSVPSFTLELGGPIAELCLDKVVKFLWFVGVLLWVATCISIVDMVIPSQSDGSGALTLVARGLLALGLVAPGVLASSFLAFGKEQPQRFSIVGVDFVMPAAPNLLGGGWLGYAVRIGNLSALTVVQSVIACWHC